MTRPLRSWHGNARSPFFGRTSHELAGQSRGRIRSAGQEGRSMSDLDLVVRNADIVTAADRFTADIGVRDGAVVALAAALPGARTEIDARGRLVTPGGVDAHC